MQRIRAEDWAPPSALESCMPEQQRILEFVALTEPVTEPALLRNLDAEILSELLARGLLAAKPGPLGAALTVADPLLAASLRESMSPLRRTEVFWESYRLLLAELARGDPRHDPDRLCRLVHFGLEGGVELPAEWLQGALQGIRRGADLRYVLKLAYAVAVHPGSDPDRAGVAARRAYRIARLIGDEARLAGLIDAARELTHHPLLSQEEWVLLQLTLLRHDLWSGSDPRSVVAALDRLEVSLPGERLVFSPREEMIADEAAHNERESVRAMRVLVLATSGSLADAHRARLDADFSNSLHVEWVRGLARSLVSLIDVQRGAGAQMLQTAEYSRMLNSLGAWQTLEAEGLHGFCWFISCWAAGDLEMARRVHDDLQAEQSDVMVSEERLSGLDDLGELLLELCGGRSRDAVRSAETLCAVLSEHDGYGVMPLAQAALALSAAMLGDDQRARRALRAARSCQPGLAQALLGIVRILLLRAQQWLHDPGTVEVAQQLAQWAREEELALIELQALHAVAFETGAADSELVERVRHLGAQIEQPIAQALVAHVERLAVLYEADEVPDRLLNGEPRIEIDALRCDEPDLRALADLGIWVPMLPRPAPELTAREREVALLAARGHTSKFIAERLLVSVRTVETHLSRVFMKLGVENRDQLWRWASHERSLMRWHVRH